MVALIVFRAIQGFGAGAVQPMALTIAGDIYSVPNGAVHHPSATHLTAGLHLVFIAIAAAAGALILGSALLPGNSGGLRTR